MKNKPVRTCLSSRFAWKRYAERHLFPKRKRHVMHRRPCTCDLIDIGYTYVYQITVDSGPGTSIILIRGQIRLP